MFSRSLVVFSIVFGSTFLEGLSMAQNVPLVTTTESDCAKSRSSPPTRTAVLARQEPSQSQVGLTVYPSAYFNGPGANYTSKFNTSIALTTNGSFQVSANFWAALVSGKDITIIWDSCLDVSALPINATRNLTITEVQSSLCQMPCSGSGGFCSASSTSSSSPCTCSPGFNGTLCETCADGHFGPKCQPCPSNCSNCDQGITGTGLCSLDSGSPLTDSTTNSTSCPLGYVKNGTTCDCNVSEGFFVDSNGGCQVCQGGCAQCASPSGNCVTCKPGFSRDSTDPAAPCNGQPTLSSNGTQCPPGSFGVSNSASCLPCSKECSTCNGGSSNDCLTCANHLPMLKNSCVSTTGDGICEGSDGLIANNLKKQCDSCGAVTPGCGTCKFSDYSAASTINEAHCTGCLPGFVLSKGKCVQNSCPSSCETCSGSSGLCLTCKEGFASSGKCVPTCPSGTFASNSTASNNTCVPCHPDCESCQGPSFDQCTSCPPTLPVPSNGRCLPTCGNPTQFFDTTALKCQPCDPTCASCSGPQPNQCLACSWPFLLQQGVCVPIPILGTQ